MTTTELRLVAHILSLAVLLAGILSIALAGRRGLSMRWRWVLITSLLCYAVWFFLLAISLRDAELLRRTEIGSVLGGTELIGALLGWAWVALTLRASFRVTTKSNTPHSAVGTMLLGK